MSLSPGGALGSLVPASEAPLAGSLARAVCSWKGKPGTQYFCSATVVALC